MAESRWRALARRSPAAAQVASCLQCGRDRVDIVGGTRGRVRVSCRACGALTLQNVSRLHAPAAKVQPPPAAAPTGLEHPLAPYVSAQLLEWATTTGRDRRAGSLDKASIYRLWKEFDRSRPDEAKPPAFGAVVGLLHAAFYDEALVSGELAGEDVEPERAAATVERIGCARRWLAGPGRIHCWIERCADAAAVAAVDVAALRSLLAAGAFDEPLSSAQREALYVAAFGATGGPPTSALLRRFDAEILALALQTHLRDGSHPLRGIVLASLNGRVDRDPRAADTPAGAAAPC